MKVAQRRLMDFSALSWLDPFIGAPVELWVKHGAA